LEATDPAAEALLTATKHTARLLQAVNSIVNNH
jgi:hypothetical protein